jgi:hypothetical protein
MRGIRKGAMYGETLGKLQRDEKELEMMREEDREPMGVLGFIRRDYKDKVCAFSLCPVSCSRVHAQPARFAAVLLLCVRALV